MKSIYTFYINESEEIENLNDLLSGDEDCSTAERAEQYHIPLEIAKKCQKDKIPSELIDFVHQAYQDKQSSLNEALQFHQTYWQGSGQQHLEKISKVMEQQLPFFRVRLDVFCAGTSDWYGTNISVKAFDYKTNPSTWYASLLWETILAVTFQKIRQKHSQEELSDHLVWAVSEMTSCAIINCEFPIIWNIGYTQLFPHQQHVFQLYQSKKSFADFLTQLIDYFSAVKFKTTL